MTDAYKKSANALMEHGFVLLLGEPASGKSTIAASLAVAALDTWGSSTIKVTSAERFSEHWNPHEKKRFFWVDDAFGATQYQRSKADEWNQRLPELQSCLRAGGKLLFTSRDYIFNAAQNDLKFGAFPLFKESQVIIHVQDLSLQEKRQILYNHIKKGRQLSAFRQKIKPFLNGMASNPNFLPEIARRIGNPLFTKNLSINEGIITEFVEKPLDFLIDVIRSLDRDSRAAIAFIFIRGGKLESPFALSSPERKVLDRLGSNENGLREALNALRESLVKLVKVEGQPEWNYKHPTIGDAYARIVASDPELLDVYLAGSPIENLIEEVVCGEFQIEGAIVEIPPSHYDSFIARLDKLPPFSPRFFGNENSELCNFLEARCNKVFLARYLKTHQSFLDEIFRRACSWFRPQVYLLAKFREFGLLPESYRRNFVEHSATRAVETPDAEFLVLKKIKSLFLDSEVQQILESFRTELAPNFSDVISDWESNYDEDDNPEDYFQPLKETIEIFGRELKNDLIFNKQIDDALVDIERSIEELYEQYSPEREPDYSDEKGYSAGSDESESPRSIFDDIDH